MHHSSKPAKGNPPAWQQALAIAQKYARHSQLAKTINMHNSSTVAMGTPMHSSSKLAMAINLQAICTTPASKPKGTNLPGNSREHKATNMHNSSKAATESAS